MKVTSRRSVYNVLVICAILLQGGASWAEYGVRLCDLTRTPVPPNPVRVWGRVVSESPFRISDGRAEIEVSGAQASVGEFVVFNGNWDGVRLHCGIVSPRRIGPAQLEMVWVPAGSFVMGASTAHDSYVNDSAELPKHSVYMSGYWIGRTEVTRGQYRRFMEAGGYAKAAYWSSEGWGWVADKGRTQPDHWDSQQNWGTGVFTQTDDHPVVGISYYEAEAFCRWAGVRLPTEAEWEKAARWNADLSVARTWAWGSSWNGGECNNYYDASPAAGGAFKSQTAPVGSYPAGTSYYGCEDMMGNVWEWCSDWWDMNYYSQTPPGGWRNPQGPASGTLKAARGGGWMDDYTACRCAKRVGALPSYGRNTFGMRAAY